MTVSLEHELLSMIASRSCGKFPTCKDGCPGYDSTADFGKSCMFANIISNMEKEENDK